MGVKIRNGPQNTIVTKEDKQEYGAGPTKGEITGEKMTRLPTQRRRFRKKTTPLLPAPLTDAISPVQTWNRISEGGGGAPSGRWDSKALMRLGTATSPHPGGPNQGYDTCLGRPQEESFGSWGELSDE